MRPRDLLYILLIALALLGGFVSGARGEEAEPEPCVLPAYLAGWLHDEGYALEDWGLMDGRLHELWRGPRGWAVVEQTPEGCARVLSLPDAPRARTGGVKG